MQSIPLYYTTFSPSCVKNASKIFVKRQRGAFQESPPLDSPKPFTPLGECEHSATEYSERNSLSRCAGKSLRDYALCSIQRLFEKAPKTTAFTTKGGFSQSENPPFGVKFLRVLRGLLSRSLLSGMRGKAPRPSFSPRISSADCCSRNSQCALSGERRREFPPRVPRLRRNLHEAVRKPRADGIPIPCGARGSAPTPPESPR